MSPYGVIKPRARSSPRLPPRLGLSSVGLRLFTVYGPRQRPDMAFPRLCEALDGDPRFISRRRLAGPRPHLRRRHRPGHDPGPVRQASRHRSTTSAADGRWPSPRSPPSWARSAACRSRPWPARRRGATCAAPRPSTARARRDLGWRPRTGLRDGLAAQLAWVRERHGMTPDLRVGLGPFQRLAEPLDGPDAAVDDVEHVAGARRAAAGSRRPPLRWPDAQITATGRPASSRPARSCDVVVGRVDRAGDVARVPLGRSRTSSTCSAGSPRCAPAAPSTSMPLDALDRPALLAPARHAAGQVAADAA